MSWTSGLSSGRLMHRASVEVDQSTIVRDPMNAIARVLRPSAAARSTPAQRVARSRPSSSSTTYGRGSQAFWTACSTSASGTRCRSAHSAMVSQLASRWGWCVGRGRSAPAGRGGEAGAVVALVAVVRRGRGDAEDDAETEAGGRDGVQRPGVMVLEVQPGVDRLGARRAMGLRLGCCPDAQLNEGLWRARRPCRRLGSFGRCSRRPRPGGR